MDLKNIELLTGAPADIIADIKPKKTYTVSEKVLKRNENARNKRLVNAIEKGNKKQITENVAQNDQLIKLLKRIEELESSNKKIKPLDVKEPAEINKPMEKIAPEEDLPQTMEEEFRAKKDIVKNEIKTNIEVMIAPPLNQNIPIQQHQQYYKPQNKVNSILPQNWGNAVQIQQKPQSTLNINKYLKGRKL